MLTKQKIPIWLIDEAKAHGPKSPHIRRLRELLDDNLTHTVCEEAKCPNVGECWSDNTLTFMILGSRCTRACGFCAIDTGRGETPDPLEPMKVARSAQVLGLKYVVVTSVARDDLPDQGAGHFAATIRAIKSLIPAADVEVLIPDFKGRRDLLQIVLDAHPVVLNHNIETVRRLSPRVRPQANYDRSLEVLANSKFLAPSIVTKSSIMLGLGERESEVVETLQDLRSVQCDIITIGQYISPTRLHLPVVDFVQPEQFMEYREIANQLGFSHVESGPLVRSSYHARRGHLAAGVAR